MSKNKLTPLRIVILYLVLGYLYLYANLCTTIPSLVGLFLGVSIFYLDIAVPLNNYNFAEMFVVLAPNIKSLTT